MKRFVAPVALLIAMFLGGVALADSVPDRERPPPPEAKPQVGDKVNGGTIVEVSDDRVVVEFLDPVLPE